MTSAGTWSVIVGHVRLPTRRRAPYTMHMAAATKLWTVDEVNALPHEEGITRELVDGVLYVTPAPTWRHGEIAGALYRRLFACAAEQGVGHVKIAPQDVIYGLRTMLQPDVFAVPLVDGRRPREWREVGRLLLAVEVLSPSTRSYDRYVKRPRYQREHVPEIWLVDADARVVELWRPHDTVPEMLDARIDWQPDPAHPPLVIDLPALFAETLDD